LRQDPRFCLDLFGWFEFGHHKYGGAELGSAALGAPAEHDGRPSGHYF